MKFLDSEYAECIPENKRLKIDTGFLGKFGRKMSEMSVPEFEEVAKDLGTDLEKMAGVGSKTFTCLRQKLGF